MKLLTNILLGYCGVLTIGTALVIDLIQIELFLCVIALLLGAILMVMVSDRQCAETTALLRKIEPRLRPTAKAARIAARL